MCRAVVLLLLVTWSASASAQRGADYGRHLEPAPSSTSGLPGLLNAEMAGEGDVILDFPMMSLDYGATANLTIGTNVLAIGPMLDGSSRVVYAKLRYRFYSTSSLVSTLTAYGTSGHVEDDPDTYDFSGVVLVSNTAWRLSENGLVTGSLFVGTGSVEVASAQDSLDYQRIRASGMALAVSYQYFFSRRFSASGSLVVVPIMVGQADSVGETATVIVTGGMHERIVARALLHFRVNARWFLSAGGYASPATQEVSPWFSVAKVW